MAKRLTEKTVNKIREMHANGLSGFEIARRTGKSRPTIYRIVHGMNGTAPKKSTARVKGNGLKEIEAIVRRAVDARLKTAKDAAIKALEASLMV